MNHNIGLLQFYGLFIYFFIVNQLSFITHLHCLWYTDSGPSIFTYINLIIIILYEYIFCCFALKKQTKTQTSNCFLN